MADRNGTQYTKVAGDVKASSRLARLIKAEQKRRHFSQANIVRWALMERYGLAGFVRYENTGAGQ